MKQLCLPAILLSLSMNAANAAPNKGYDIRVEDVAAQTEATAKGSATLADFEAKLGQAFGKVSAFLATNNLQPAGAPFSRYAKFSEEGVDFEAGFPIDKVIASSTDVVVKTRPAQKTAVTLHVGPNSEVGAAYKALHVWIKASGYTEAGAPWEVYLDDPATTPADKIRTMVYYPIKAAKP